MNAIRIPNAANLTRLILQYASSKANGCALPWISAARRLILITSLVGHDIMGSDVTGSVSLEPDRYKVNPRLKESFVQLNLL